jgi:hypothetical protein
MAMAHVGQAVALGEAQALPLDAWGRTCIAAGRVEAAAGGPEAQRSVLAGQAKGRMHTRPVSARRVTV